MSWFMLMEVLDSIYHQFIFTANSLGQQPTTSQFFQPLTPQTLALVATAIHCVLSQYATGKKITIMFSQDEYRGKFYPSTVTDCISAEAIALIKFKLHMVGQLHTLLPPMVLVRYTRRSSIPVGAPESTLVLLNPRWRSSIPVGAPQSSLALLNPRWRSAIPVGAPQSPLALLNSRWHSSIPVGAPQSPLALRNPHWRSIIPVGAPQSLSALLNPRRRFSIPVGAPQSPSAPLNPIGPPLSGLVLRYFIQHFILPFPSALLL